MNRIKESSLSNNNQSALIKTQQFMIILISLTLNFIFYLCSQECSEFYSSTTCAPGSSLSVKCSALDWFVSNLSDGNVLEPLEHLKIDVKSFAGGTMGCL